MQLWLQVLLMVIMSLSTTTFFIALIGGMFEKIKSDNAIAVGMISLLVLGACIAIVIDAGVIPLGY